MVFAKAALSLPPKIEDWDVVHVGAWLAVHMGLPPKGLKALRNGLDGMKLLEMSPDQMQVFLDTTLDDDLSSKLQSLIETGRYGSQQIEDYIGAVQDERRVGVTGTGVVSHTTKKKKKKTLMSERLSGVKHQQEEEENEDSQEVDFEVDKDIVTIEDELESPPPSYHKSNKTLTGGGSAVTPLRNAVSNKKSKAETARLAKSAEDNMVRKDGAPVTLGRNKDGEGGAKPEAFGKTVSFQTPEKLNPESREKNILFRSNNHSNNSSSSYTIHEKSSASPEHTPHRQSEVAVEVTPATESEEEEEYEIIPSAASVSNDAVLNGHSEIINKNNNNSSSLYTQKPKQMQQYQDGHNEYMSKVRRYN